MVEKKTKTYEDSLIEDMNSSFGKESTSSAGYLHSSSTAVKRRVSTGSFMLDVVLANAINGGMPVGRLIEISGGEGAGKTLLASYMLADTQKQGGIGIMIDTEHAASMEVLHSTGVDLQKLIYVQAGCVEDVFANIETIIKKISDNKDKPLITIVWDSVAATSSRAEIEGDYDQRTIAMSARLISQGLRKIIPVISQHNVCLVFINQLRTKIGGMAFGDNSVTPGGRAIPYHASVRLRLNHFKKLVDPTTKDEIGKIVQCKVEKNKVAPPMRTIYYYLSWGTKPGAWIDVPESLWDAGIRSGVLKKVNNQKYSFTSTSTKKDIELTKKSFAKILDEEEFASEFKTTLANAYIITAENIAKTIKG